METDTQLNRSPFFFFFFLVCCAALWRYLYWFLTHNDYGLEPSAIGSRRNNNEREKRMKIKKKKCGMPEEMKVSLSHSSFFKKRSSELSFVFFLPFYFLS
jgi:hypothetical protein